MWQAAPSAWKTLGRALQHLVGAVGLLLDLLVAVPGEEHCGGGSWRAQHDRVWPCPLSCVVLSMSKVYCSLLILKFIVTCLCTTSAPYLPGSQALSASEAQCPQGVPPGPCCKAVALGTGWPVLVQLPPWTVLDTSWWK